MTSRASAAVSALVSSGLLLGFIPVVAVLGLSAATLAVPVPQDAELQRLIDQAQQAMRDAQWQRAIDAWTSVLSRSPGNTQALDGLSRAQAALNMGGSVEQVGRDLEVLRQKTKVEFEAGLARAQDARSQGDYEGAKKEIYTALAKVNERRPVLSEPEYASMKAQADDLLAKVEEERERAALAAQMTAAEEAKANKEREQAAASAKRQQLVTANIQRIRQLQMEQKYDEALRVVDETLFLDQHNEAVLALRDVLETTVAYREVMRIDRDRQFAYQHESTATLRGTLPPRKNLYGPGPRSLDAVMEYPEDWESLSIRRDLAAGFRETDADRAVRMALAKTMPVDISPGTTFEQVVAYFKQVAQVPVYADWKALDLINVRRDDQVELHLGTVPGDRALAAILDQLGNEFERPQYSIEGGMLVISSDSALRKRVVTIVYDIRDLLFQVPYFDNAPEFDLASSIAQSNAGGVRGGGTGGGTFGGNGEGGSGGGIFSRPGEDPARKTRKELVDQIITILQEVVDSEGWRDLGGDTGSIQELNGNLIITNTPRNHQQIDGLLTELRRIRALQLNVEARLLTVTNNWFEQVGVDLDMYFNTNNTMFQQAKAVDPNFQLGDFFGPSGFPKDAIVFDSPTATNAPPAQGAVPGVPYANTFGTGYLFGTPTGGPPPTDITYVTGPVGAPIRQTTGFSPIALVNNSIDNLQELAGSGLSDFALAAAANPALVAGFSYMDDVQIDLLITATQADRRNVVLTAPRLTLFNGQRSWVAVANSITYISNLIPSTGDSSGAFQPVLGLVYQGFVLDIEGVISADRRYVTLTVAFDLNQNVDFASVTVTGAAGGGGINGGRAANFEGTIQLPRLAGTQIRTTVSVPDKGTALLGGQRTSNEFEVEEGVPVLSKIPIVNRFFTNRLSSRDESTLLLLIRPEIIIQQEQEDILFPKLAGQLGGQ